MAKLSARSSIDECTLNESSGYEPFFAKKFTLSKYSRWAKGTKTESKIFDKVADSSRKLSHRKRNADPIEEGIVYSNCASQSSDSCNSDTEGLYIDLDPPVNYKKRPSVNCFTTPLVGLQASFGDNKLQTTTESKHKVKHSASQTELKIKIIGTKKHKSKDHGNQTDIVYEVVSPENMAALSHRGSLDKKRRTYGNRSKRRSHNSNNKQSERSSSHKKKRHRHHSSDGDSDMDPPTRGGDV